MEQLSTHSTLTPLYVVIGASQGTCSVFSARDRGLIWVGGFMEGCPAFISWLQLLRRRLVSQERWVALGRLGGGMPRRAGLGLGQAGLSTAVVPLPGWATCPKRLGPGGSPPGSSVNGHQFSEGAGHRDKTTVTRGP